MESDNSSGDQKATLGCGTLILIALIVIFFSNRGVDNIEDSVDRVNAKLQNVESAIAGQTSEIEKLRAVIDSQTQQIGSLKEVLEKP